MTGHRLEHQYLRLLALFPRREQQITLQALADKLCCSKRHMRSLLVAMQARHWLTWTARPGRGHQARLQLLCSAPQLQMEKAEGLLKSGDFAAALDLLGEEQHLIAPLLRARLGYNIRDDYQSLRIPYYRTMPNLYPGTPLRRSERHLVRQIFNGLTRINDKSGVADTDLAHDWRRLDPLHWRFFLRPGVQFHDGRELTSQDVVASLTRCAALPLFSHVKTIEAQGLLSVVIALTEPDDRLPQLLADPAALILPADHAARADFAAHPVGTGPYKVCDNDEWHLRMRVFDHYFGFRGLLDELEVIVWPELAPPPHRTAQDRDDISRPAGAANIATGPLLEASSSAWLSSSISDIDFASGFAAGLTGKPSDACQEMFLERGGYFLLCDSRSPYWHGAEQRRWIREKLDPASLVQRLDEKIRPLWVPAGSLLPDWSHAMDKGPALPPGFTATGQHAPGLRLAYHHQHPEYPMLAAEMKTILAAEGVDLTLVPLDYDTWARGDAGADLWLGTVNFAVPESWSAGAWLLEMPLLRHSISGGDTQTFCHWLQQWRSGQLSSEQLMQQVVSQGWLQPLFHHWMRLKGPEQAVGIHLNNLGWFDFASTWMEPGQSG